MKYPVGVALLSLLSACHLLTHPSHQQAAITAYVVRTIDDPDSYQALWWSTPRIVSRADKARMDRLAASQAYATANQKAQADSLAYRLAAPPERAVSSSPGLTPEEAARRRCLRSAGARDSLRYLLRHLAASTDTARYGYLIAHGYSARNSAGKPFRDSALFLVDVEANVTRWRALKQVNE